MNVLNKNTSYTLKELCTVLNTDPNTIKSFFKMGLKYAIQKNGATQIKGKDWNNFEEYNQILRH